MFQVRCDYRYLNGIGIVLVYFLNGMPFVYDDITDAEKEDIYVKSCAESRTNIERWTLDKKQWVPYAWGTSSNALPVELDEVSVLPP